MATSLPKTMKGVLIEKTGGVEVLQYKNDLPVPTPKEGEVLVKNNFVGINYIDTYFPLPPSPLITNSTLVISALAFIPLRSLTCSAAKVKEQSCPPAQEMSII